MLCTVLLMMTINVHLPHYPHVEITLCMCMCSGSCLPVQQPLCVKATPLFWRTIADILTQNCIVRWTQNCMVWFSYTWIWNETCVHIDFQEGHNSWWCVTAEVEQLITDCTTTVSLSWQPDVVGTLTSVLKLTRNLCTGVPENDTVRGSPFIIKYLRGGSLIAT